MREERDLGVVEWFERGEHERVERVVAGLRELGVERLRTAVSWAEWHVDGGRHWYDWLVPRLAREFELLPCLHYTPPSLGVVPKSSAPPRRPRDYADFLDVFIDRFGHLFEHVELWNEPNNLNDWDWRLDPNWETFCRMVGDAAYWARRRGKRTVLGGMSPTDPHWLELVASRGVLAYVDVVGIHAFPGSWTTVWNGWGDEFASVRDVLAAAGARSEVWVTEAGFSTWRRDEFGQVQAFLDVLAAPAERVYWYAAEDLSVARPACDGDHVDPRHYHFGLRTEDGHPKLLARALRRGGLPMARLLSGLERKPRPPSGRRYSLVTGGAGFVGTNLADRLLRDGKHVLVFDNLVRPGVEQNVAWLENRHQSRCRVQIGDLRDPLALREAVSGADEVFHLGAQVAVTTSIERPLEDWSVNLEGTVRLLEEMRRLREPPPLLFTSTNKVYGTLQDVRMTSARGRWEPADPGLRARGIDERRPLDFCTPYGCSKGAADQYVLDYAKTFGLQAVVFRMSCIYGFHQHGNEDQGWVAHFLLRSLEGEPIAIYGDGHQVRDVLFVSDLVEAMLLAREQIAALSGRAFNIGGGPQNTTSLLELVALIDELNGGSPPVVFGDERPGDQRWYVTDTSRFSDATGWAPTVSAREGVEALYSWFGRRHSPDELLATV